MKAKTLGELKKSGYQYRGIREELRSNLIQKLKRKEPIFDGIYGYDHTVIPDVERAILSGHNILFLGLRGQAKTRMARLLSKLLDEHIPIIQGSEINDDPLHPISKYAIEQIALLGDQCPIEWIGQAQRYVEKLATPDVSIADLIGDLDPIKAAQKKISYDNEFAIHFGLIPRSNRSIFVINELSDLQARIQVALFNILEENDLQIRGFKIKLPLDIFFMFTANPEDYTQRGTIITPLKDRIESQILTHYPDDIETALKISLQEASMPTNTEQSIYIPNLMHRIIEQISFTARESDLIDDKSGISARLSIAAIELLHSAIERRMILNNEKKGTARLADLLSIVPALTGKMELVYEGEQMGAYDVALSLINESILNQVAPNFPPIQSGTKMKTVNPYQQISDWFSKGNHIAIGMEDSEALYQKVITSIPETKSFLKTIDKKDHNLGIECILHIISGANIIQKEWLDQRITFKDQLASMLSDLDLSSN
ncbi:MAG: magnesium chelatase [Saprospiraceae bacterium]|nr:magnesium chelatase [Saprospiraceae bacterium]MBK9221486.1 magnesium chelatase [Saprospiraceae bacterium]MBK9721576.1 magnesium chelatase [Saprospiraceae bacterium]